MLSVVDVLVTVRGICSTTLTVMVAVAVGPPKPCRPRSVDSCTVKLPVVSEFNGRRELQTRPPLGRR